MKTIAGLVFLLILAILGAAYVKTGKVNTSLVQIVPKFGSFPKPTPDVVIPKNCDGKITPNVIDGPYYKESSPERTDFNDPQVPGEALKIKGYVFDTNCNPVAHAWIDFWQANSQGVYDNDKFLLRGHQYTDPNGRYHLETIIPGPYTGRTPHIHAKVQASPQSPLVTTQLYFPGQSRNNEDSIFDPATLIKIEDRADGKWGYFNFVVSVK